MSAANGQPPHDHDHDHDHDAEEGESSHAFIAALARARGGLRSDVQHLIQHLDEGALFVPLAEDIPDAPEGEELELDGELSFRPHMLLDEDEQAFVVAYTDPALVEVLESSLGWRTSGDELKFVRIPARTTLAMVLEDLGDDMVGGLAINPSTEEELVLARDEVASILGGQAIPLVGYVEELPEGLEEATQVVEGAEPPPPALLEALEQARKKIPDLVSFLVQTTFNAERDREPHLTITLHLARPDAPRGAIADDVMELISPHLPPPSYADIVFRDAPN